ncbi:MAG: DNA topoisomerase III [Peptococcaceae bacterium]|nr:DNA topoisomerase III [Peptococcaceae bacterium]
MKTLVLAEKPGVGRELARILQCSRKTKGYIEGSQFIVTWSLGHLVTLAEPEDYDQKYREWRLEDLPMLPFRMKLKVIRQTSHQFRIVKDLMNRKDVRELIIATDAGREGELVARWIMALANWKKPFKRLWISSQTDEAIREGFANLKAGIAYNNLYDAAVCRAEADWLIGLNVTRALTCRFNAQLNAGRVQTPTLAMMVNRESEIKQFVPVDYWTIQVDFGDYYANWTNKSGSRRIFNRLQAEKIAAKIKGHQAVVKDIQHTSKSEGAPLAYDLTELQRDANKRLGYSAQKTLSVLQNLYEQHKLVTYPRTDSRYITTDIVPTLTARLKNISVVPYTALVKPLLQKPLKPNKRFVDDNKVTDHHAIIPTEQHLVLSSLKEEERKLYDLIVRRFIAVLYPPYRYNSTTIVTVVNNEYFHSRGRVVKDKGWRAVTSITRENDQMEEEKLPDQNLTQQKKGDIKNIKSYKISKFKTRPPSRYTEATLLTAMECPGKFIEDEELRETMKGSGLGTPATRAEIIEKLLKTSYIERHGRELVPTSKGIQLISLVDPALKTPELTAQWEQKLSDIARGKGNKKKFMHDIRRNAAELVKGVSTSTATYKADNISKTKCPICGKYMLLINGRRGKMLSCPDRACGFRQPEKQDYSGHRGSKRNSQMNQRLIARYSQQGSIGSNVGELLLEALEKGKNNN